MPKFIRKEKKIYKHDGIPPEEEEIPRGEQAQNIKKQLEEEKSNIDEALKEEY